MEGPNLNNNPRIIVIQKLYGYYLNKSSNIEIQKHRYKKFIKDTISGTIEREELLLENLKTILQKEFNPARTDLILKLMILSATYELMFSHKTPVNVIVSEYVKISDFFLESAHKGYLNAVLDKISQNLRKDNWLFLPFTVFFGNFLFFKKSLGRYTIGKFIFNYISRCYCCSL